MSEDLTARYNYSTFRRESFEPLMSFDQSPAVGSKVDSFPLVSIDEPGPSDLAAILRRSQYTVVEFGSFT